MPAPLPASKLARLDAILNARGGGPPVEPPSVVVLPEPVHTQALEG
jgi:hypothetical protein